jgi:hypothetical protein
VFRGATFQREAVFRGATFQREAVFRGRPSRATPGSTR